MNYNTLTQLIVSVVVLLGCIACFIFSKDPIVINAAVGAFTFIIGYWLTAPHNQGKQAQETQQPIVTRRRRIEEPL